MKIKNYLNTFLICCIFQTGWAQEAQSPVPVVPVPPPPGALPSSDAAQFQTWLNNNAQLAKPAETIPPPPLVVSPNRPTKLPPKRSVCPRKPVIPAQQLVVRGEPVIIMRPMPLKRSQQIMMRSLPKAPPPNRDARDAFNIMKQQNIPLTPQQILTLRQLIDSSQRAASTPPTIPPKPVSSTLLINLSPGTTPPAIRLAQGFVTSLVFVDSSGAPWPIESFNIGDPKAVNIQWDGKTNIMAIQAVTPYSYGDLVLRLVGLPTPITLELISGQRVVDFRVDIHVPGLGPETKEIPTGIGLPNSANQLLLNVLEGVAPPDSKQLTVCGTDGQAWLVGNTMYLRMRHTVLSPGWIGKMVSPDGMIAYEMPRSSSILISRYGQPMVVRLGGF